MGESARLQPRAVQEEKGRTREVPTRISSSGNLPDPSGRPLYPLARSANAVSFSSDRLKPEVGELVE